MEGRAPSRPPPVRKRERAMKHQWIGGKWLKSSRKQIAVINPATEEVIDNISRGTIADANQAVQAARAAFRDWRWVPAAEKAAMLHAIARDLRVRQKDLATLMTM